MKTCAGSTAAINRLRVAIIDAQPLFRAGITAVLRDSANVDLIAEGDSAAEALRVADKHQLDIMLIDIGITGCGSDAVATIARMWPAMRIVVLTTSERAEDVTASLQNGARGYILKHIDAAPGEDAVLPWIHRITTNHCLNVIRDARRHAEPVEHVPEQIDDEFEDSVVTRDFANRVLAATPDELKQPALMYHARGIEQARVAEALGVSRRTVLYRLAEFTRRAMRMQEIAEA